MTDDASDLAKIAKKANDTYALLSNLSLAHEMLKLNSQDSFNECIKKIANSNQEASQKIGELADLVKKSVQEFNSLKNEISNKHRLFTAEIKELKDYLTKLAGAQHDLRVSDENSDKKIFALHTTTNLALNANLEKVKKDLDEKIKNLPIPSDTVNSEKVYKQIEEKIEPTRREASTATSGIRGHETRLMLLEKKMENALAQLKTLEFK